MTRIFLVLAAFAVGCVLAAMALGLSLGDIRYDPSAETQSWAVAHRLTGVGAALAVVLVDSIVATYFVGTSRWCKEVAETYRLDPALAARSAALKRRTFPWTVGSMLIVVGIVALGGAADPATGKPNTDVWVWPHLAAALLGLGGIVWAAIVQWNNIHANYGVISEILDEVKKIRAARGLDA